MTRHTYVTSKYVPTSTIRSIVTNSAGQRHRLRKGLSQTLWKHESAQKFLSTSNNQVSSQGKLCSSEQYIYPSGYIYFGFKVFMYITLHMPSPECSDRSFASLSFGFLDSISECSYSRRDK